MIVRRIRPEELKRTEELFSVAFEFPYEQELNAEALYKEKSENPKSREDLCLLDKFAAFDELEDGSLFMFSCLSATRFPMFFDGNRVEMAGVGGVSSLPSHRNRGGIRKCFEVMLPELYKSGAEWGYLYPFSTAYYRKFGFEMAVQGYTYTLNLSHLPRFKEPGYTVLADASSRERLYPAVKEVYGKFSGRYNYMICNEDFEYKFITEADPYKKMEFVYVAFAEDDSPRGYVTFTKERVGNTQYLHAKRFAFTDTKGLKLLLDLLSTLKADHLTVDFTLPTDIDLEGMLQEFSFGAVSKTVAYLGMSRVLNVQKVLEKASYIGDGEFSVAVTDGQIDENNGVFAVSFRDGKAVSVEKKEGGEADVSMPVNIFSRLIGGSVTNGSFEYIPDLVVNNMDKENLLKEQVFVTKPGFLCEYF